MTLEPRIKPNSISRILPTADPNSHFFIFIIKSTNIANKMMQLIYYSLINKYYNKRKKNKIIIKKLFIYETFNRTAYI